MTNTVGKCGAGSAREAAALAAFMLAEEGAWSEGALDRTLSRTGLSGREAAFATRLFYGTVQNVMLLDWYLRHFSSLRLKKIEPRVKICLRMGLYELIMMDRVPEHAAVNETVSLVRRLCHANERTVGFANAVMRSAARAVSEGALPLLSCSDKADYYSLRYSHPEWLVRELFKEYGEELAGRICELNNEYASVCVRVNHMKATPSGVLSELGAAGFQTTPHPKVPEVMLCTGGNITSLPCFKEGRVTIQDTSGVVAVSAAAPVAGMFVIDCCAAPGGKSFLIAEKMRNTGRIMACDIYPNKLERIKEGAERLGLKIIEPVLQDACELRTEWEGRADIVFCDVPCSGFGVIRKKPEIRYRDKEKIAELPELQKKIISNCARYVKPGGLLVYSTCTILRRENDEVIDAFLADNPLFHRECWSHPVCGERPEGSVTLLTPIHNTDGFFIARLRRAW